MFKPKSIIVLTVLMYLVILAGCGSQPDISDTLTQAEETDTAPAETDIAPTETDTVPTENQEPSEELSPPLQEEMIFVSDRDTVKKELLESIQQLRQPRIMDIASIGLEYPEMDVKNIYFEITAQYPELKYAYNLTVEMNGTEMNCQLYYMPYKTGMFPEGFLGEEVTTIKDLLVVAENHMGEVSVPVYITNTMLEPDVMNRALQQVGGGYILCTLNMDATALQYSAPAGMTMEDCVAALKLADDLADEVIANVITPDMTQREQAEAIYSYLAQNVSYDQRYYSDRVNMPYESQTAVGALRDHTAICSGYANALKILYEKLGIPCYNVTGLYFREHHMWNLAKLDGEWLWFDVTSDRGNSSEYGFLRFALTELDEVKYQYKESDIQPLLD
ncbi:MAG: transglutaminase domain-containing protein [Lachnospiraceae bacterium]